MRALDQSPHLPHTSDSSPLRTRLCSLAPAGNVIHNENLTTGERAGGEGDHDIIGRVGRARLPPSRTRWRKLLSKSQLALGKSTAESLLKGSEQVGEWLAKDDDLELTAGSAIRADGGVLRQLHAWLKEKDPTFGGLIRVQNKRSEFLWVHPQFEGEY